RVVPRQVGDGDLVPQKAEVSDLTHTRDKLDSKWEGSYHDIDIIRDGTYLGYIGGKTTTENVAYIKLEKVLCPHIHLVKRRHFY
ncbi:hypothetical protein BHE74_00021638, partial [Ensete ventricosum]